MIGKSLLLVLATLLTTSWMPAVKLPTYDSVRLLDIRWYHDGPNGITSNGELFNPYGLTYASKSDIIGTVVKVEWSGHAVVVRCNDRGPNEVELSLGAFQKIANPDIGVLRKAKVTKIK